MAKVLALKGMIHSKFDSEVQMSNALGWNRQRLNKITTGKKEPDLDEVQSIANILGVSFMDVAQIFLHQQSPDGDN